MARRRDSSVLVVVDVNGPARVTLPVLVTTVAVADGVIDRGRTDPGVAVLTRVSRGAWSAVTVRVVGVEVDSIRVGGRRVGHRARVEVGLGDRVGRGAGDRSPGARLTLAGQVDRRLVVVDRDGAVQGHVAGVGHEVAVADGVADLVVRARGRGLDQGQRGRAGRR